MNVLNLLKNPRKTECGAKQFPIRLVVRAAPFALLKHSRIAVLGLLPCAFAADTSLIPAPESFAAISVGHPHTYTLRTPQQQAAYNAWKYSVVAVAASQALDVASSWSMREVNPLLANSEGRFGMKAAGIKFGTTGAILAAQYWVLKTHPNKARKMAVLNWAGTALTSALAAHNFSIR